jgi:hypothetical protein
VAQPGSDSLEASGVGFALAHDVGQVRDVLDHEPGTATIPVYRTVAAAVEAMRMNEPEDLGHVES